MSQIESPYFAFRTVYNQTVNTIKTPGLIINPNNNKKHKSSHFVWDTGATASSKWVKDQEAHLSWPDHVDSKVIKEAKFI